MEVQQISVRVGHMKQSSKFTSAVGKCQGDCCHNPCFFFFSLRYYQELKLWMWPIFLSLLPTYWWIASNLLMAGSNCVIFAIDSNMECYGSGSCKNHYFTSSRERILIIDKKKCLLKTYLIDFCWKMQKNLI